MTAILGPLPKASILSQQWQLACFFFLILDLQKPYHNHAMKNQRRGPIIAGISSRKEFHVHKVARPEWWVVRYQKCLLQLGRLLSPSSPPLFPCPFLTIPTSHQLSYMYYVQWISLLLNLSRKNTKIPTLLMEKF